MARPATVAICVTCWNDQEPGREPVRLVEEEREIEVCYRCGVYTLSGIYVRRMVEEKDNERPGES